MCCRFYTALKLSSLLYIHICSLNCNEKAALTPRQVNPIAIFIQSIVLTSKLNKCLYIGISLNCDHRKNHPDEASLSTQPFVPLYNQVSGMQWALGPSMNPGPPLPTCTLFSTFVSY